MRREIHQQMNVIALSVHFRQFSLEVIANLREYLPESGDVFGIKHFTPVFRRKDQMGVK